MSDPHGFPQPLLLPKDGTEANAEDGGQMEVDKDGEKGERTEKAGGDGRDHERVDKMFVKIFCNRTFSWYNDCF